MASYFKSNQRLDLPPHKPQLSAQRLPSDAQQKQSKFYSFLLKGAFIAIAIVLLPLYPSQAPEFTNHTIFNRGWEFLRLGIIGVALSYGILSRRRAETEKEVQAQIDSTQSYVSKILQVSPVFDNENDAATYNDSGKGQTWSSLYSPSEPMVMVAAEEDDYYHHRLSLPVRSLRSGRPDAEASASVHKVPDVKGGRPATVSANARSAYSIRNGKREIGVSNLSNLHGNAEGNVVLPSPIPWGSRSGSLETKEGIGLRPPGVVPPSVSESELPASPSPVPWGSRPSSASTPSPRSSPSHSVSPTRRPASVQKAAINPTPTFVSSIIDSVSAAANDLATQDKNLRKNMKHSESFDDSLVGKSVRRVRKSESMNSRSGVGSGLADESRERRSRRSSEPSADENSARKNRDGNYVMADKPERQNRGTKNEPEETLSRKSRETESSVAGKTEKKNREAEVLMVEKTQSYEPPPPPPLEEFVKYEQIWKKEKIDELKAQTEESTEMDEDDDEEEEEHEQEQERKNDVHTHTETEANEPKPVVETVIDANEVDKKADEFIAKFREQIRLQRIESIKRASAQKKKAKPAPAT